MQLRTKILSAILLFTFTFSTTGIVMNKHLCNGDVKNVTAYVKAEHCGHSKVVEKNIPKCHQTQEESNDESCCENDTQELRVKDQTLAYHKISIEQLSVFYSIKTSFVLTDEENVFSSNHTSYASPPPISTRQSLHIIHEQYLI